MQPRAIPNDIDEYFQNRLAELHVATRLLVILDPAPLLHLDDKVIDSRGKEWAVFNYCENDLVFRAKYSKKADMPNLAHIVWVTPPPFGNKDTVNLSFIGDVLRKAEKIIDFSLQGVLSQLIPKEKWLQDTLAEHMAIISSNLACFVKSYSELRLHIAREKLLSIHHIRILALRCLKPGLPVQDLLFDEVSVSDVLSHYLRLAWSNDWDGQSFSLLRQIASESPKIDMAAISPWFVPQPESLALYVYLRRSLERYSISNPVNQLRGLGILDFDLEGLEPELPGFLGYLGKSTELRARMLQVAEEQLAPRDLEKLVDLISPVETTEILQALAMEISPAVAYGLADRLMETVLALEDAGKMLLHPDIHRSIASVSSEIESSETQYSQRAKETIGLILQLSRIEAALVQPFETASELGDLVDWYINSRTYQLSLSYARIRGQLRVVANKELQKKAEKYLSALGNRINERVQIANLNLASIIQSDWPKYLSHPRLATNVLRNTILKRVAHTPKKPRIWVLVFDGMRYDSWNEVVKPLLAKQFEIAEEKSYVCVLPSVTGFARVSLLAGNIPSHWINYHGKPTSDHFILAAKLFGLLEKERNEQLRLVVSSETDTGQQRLDIDPKPYNILVYNLSDDWIHSYRDSIWELNKIIAEKVKDGILPDLVSRIAEGDIVVVSSDHGFIELDRMESTEVRAPLESQRFKDEDPGNPVRYRYLKGIEHAEGVPVRYGEGKTFTVAKGRSWFNRPNGKYTRYTHGGISLEEMIVPGAVLKKIVTPAIAFQFAGLPDRLEVTEDQEATIQIVIKNSGNREGQFSLAVQVDTGEKQEYARRLVPKSECKLHFAFMPKFGKKQMSTRITCNLAYDDVYDKKQILTPKIVPVIVSPRKDKVEIDLSALDKLE